MATIPKLKITCGSSDCENGRHTYNDPSHTYKVRSGDRVHLESGVCKSCGAAAVDWTRVHRRDISDLEYTIESLKTEYIRWEFWNKSFNKTTLDNALRDGRGGIFAGVGQLLAKSVGPWPKPAGRCARFRRRMRSCVTSFSTGATQRLVAAERAFPSGTEFQM